MKPRQHGIALITALLVLAIAVVLAASLAHEGALALRRSENLLHHTQAMAYLQGAEDWARRILARDAREVDHLGEAWATPLPPIPVEGGEITGRLIDLQGRLNLNALLAHDNQLAPRHAQRLACVLRQAGIEQPEAALEALADWQDEDSVVRPLGAEDGGYANLPHPYRTANQPLLAASELALIQGFSTEAVARLTTLTAALPKSATLNLNTAPPEVLVCLSEGLTPEDWRAFIETRAKTPLKKVDELLAHPPFQGRLDPTGLGVTSQVFLLEANARIGRTVARRYSVFLRETDGIVRVQSRFQESP
ncbi:MAG: type II secretion system minor pseudopilin GspK [Halothiobacillaceae bacterium]